ncbi:unannotated protein [freshwater metagenome]|jgi:hypothetical protein|uniref:Unannotated protein n=1 Tax=freshwater metagenome TaxID=449393 RepID=A0A6J7JM68_9ZZZZ|nr:hypothetical protein [Actinomycetota bacterium]
MPNGEHQISLTSASASPEEAAAAIAAVERFLRETAAPAQSAAPSANPWARAALLEGAGHEPDAPSPWGDPVPW